MAGMQELGLLSIAPSILAALYQAGFHTSRDVQGINARELSNVASISLQDAASVLNTLQGGKRTPLGVSALDIYQQSKQQKRIRTFIPDLDEILGGGIAAGEITEICGVPGVGKTQLSIHLALCAQYCNTSESTLAESIYIDTEGSFLVPRVVSLAESVAASHRDEVTSGTAASKEDLLRGITYFRVYDYQEQHDVLLSLSRLLASRPKVRLVLLDSVAFHCRHAFEDNNGRARALHNMSVVLRKLVCDFPIAVVLVNHVTTSVGYSGSDSTIIPALGEAWSHVISTRLLLGWEHQVRTVQVMKSISEGSLTAYFEVTEHGIQPHSRKRSRSSDDETPSY